MFRIYNFESHIVNYTKSQYEKHAGKSNSKIHQRKNILINHIIKIIIGIYKGANYNMECKLM